MGVSRKCGVAKHANYGALRWIGVHERGFRQGECCGSAIKWKVRFN